jgi:hypothetical protein
VIYRYARPQVLNFREPRFEEIRACSPGPPTLVVPLHMGFQRIDSGTNWVSEKAVHRKLDTQPVRNPTVLLEVFFTLHSSVAAL